MNDTPKMTVKELQTELLDPNIRGNEGLRLQADAKIREMSAAMNEFCDRVEAGEIRSRRTYGKFKEILGR